MNEQLIGDLFAEATRRMTGSSSREFSQKFAELIVAECAQLAEYAGYNQQFGQGGLRAKLHKHFGIEE